jgi:hypothetical protein
LSFPVIYLRLYGATAAKAKHASAAMDQIFCSAPLLWQPVINPCHDIEATQPTARRDGSWDTCGEENPSKID